MSIFPISGDPEQLGLNPTIPEGKAHWGFLWSSPNTIRFWPGSFSILQYDLPYSTVLHCTARRDAMHNRTNFILYCTVQFCSQLHGTYGLFLQHAAQADNSLTLLFLRYPHEGLVWKRSPLLVTYPAVDLSGSRTSPSARCSCSSDWRSKRDRNFVFSSCSSLLTFFMLINSCFKSAAPMKDSPFSEKDREHQDTKNEAIFQRTNAKVAKPSKNIASIKRSAFIWHWSTVFESTALLWTVAIPQQYRNSWANSPVRVQSQWTTWNTVHCAINKLLYSTVWQYGQPLEYCIPCVCNAQIASNSTMTRAKPRFRLMSRPTAFEKLPVQASHSSAARSSWVRLYLSWAEQLWSMLYCTLCCTGTDTPFGTRLKTPNGWNKISYRGLHWKIHCTEGNIKNSTKQSIVLLLPLKFQSRRDHLVQHDCPCFSCHEVTWSPWRHYETATVVGFVPWCDLLRFELPFWYTKC